MGALLIAGWIGDATAISIVDDASVAEARALVRDAAASLAPTAREQLVTAASELARNQLVHAGGGTIGVRAISRSGVAGLEVIAADGGRGIADPSTALQGTPRASGSLGVGLSAARRQVEEMDIDVRIGAGSCVRVRSFVSPVTRSEVGVFSLAHPDETVIGDHAQILRDDRTVTIAVADGLGHGAPARDSAERVIGVVATTAPLEQLFAQAHQAVLGARGAVMAIARVGTEIEYASVGNIGSRIIGSDGTVRMLSAMSGTLGSALPRRILTEKLNRQPDDSVVICTDGILTRFDLSEAPAIVRAHPVAIAHYIVRRFARGTDDALVVVAR